jgi:HIV Tat-specific factor 1
MVWCAAGSSGGDGGVTGSNAGSGSSGSGWVRLAEAPQFDGQIGPEVLEASRAEREAFLAAEAKKEENKKRKREKAALNQTAGSRWKKAPVNHSNVYFTGLPLDVTAEELGDFAKKAGIIQTDEEGKRRVKIYLDEQGKPKGDGLVKYALPDSVPLAITLLDQAVFRPASAKNPAAVVVGVQKATFEMKGEAFDASKVDPKLLLAAQHKRAKLAGGAAAAEAKKHEVGALTAAEIQRQKLAESLSWAEDDSFSGGSSRLRIVILKPMFTPADAAAHPHGEEAFYDELRDEIGAEVEAKVSQAAVIEDEPASARAGPRKAGCIDKLTVFAGNPEGPVAVKFRSSAHAAACIALMNGRYFAGRTLSAFYFDGRTNYVVKKADDEAETEKRLKEFGDWIEKGEDEE